MHLAPLLKKQLKPLALTIYSAFICAVSSAALAEDIEEGEYYPQIDVMRDFSQSGGMEQRLAPHGNDLMGDKIDLSTGGIQFEHVDINIPGNSGLEGAVRRTLKQGEWQKNPHQHAFGDWVLEAPIAYFKYTTHGGNSPAFNGGCIQSKGRAGHSVYDTWIESDSIGDGLILDIPGKQTSGFAADGNLPFDPKFEYVSTQQTAADGTCQTITTGPDGTKYKFARHVIRTAPEYHYPYENFYCREVNDNDPQSGQRCTHEKYLKHIDVKYAVLLVTEVQDIHGNWVKYDYTGSRAELTRIYSNDGRDLRINYRSASAYARDSRVIDSITAIDAKNENHQIWKYESFNSSTTGELKKVTLPDGRYWYFGDSTNHRGLNLIQAEAQQFWDCVPWRFAFSIKHPDGAIGTFTIQEKNHIRGMVNHEVYGEDDWAYYLRPYSVGWHTWTNNDDGSLNASCYATWNAGASTGRAIWEKPEGWPTYKTMSLISKTIEGDNIPTAEWDYEYRNYDGGALDYNWSVAAGPDGKVTVNFYEAIGTEFGLLKKVEVRQLGSGQTLQSLKGTHSHQLLTAINGLPLLEKFEYQYDADVKFSFGDYECAGDILSESAGVCQTYNERPKTKVTHTREGVTYTTQYGYNKNGVNRLIDYGPPNKVTRYSSLQSSQRVTDYSYWHNLSNNIISLPKKLTKNGKVVRQTTYKSNGLPEKEYLFGIENAAYTHHSDGNLSTLKDNVTGQQRTWSWRNYYRGQAQNVTRPDGATQSRVVDSFGRVTSVTNARNYTTNFSYDIVGRIKSITPPVGRNAITFNYSNLGNGITQQAKMGGLTVTTDYDQMYRPRLVTQDSGITTYTKTDFDALGRVSFQSWPSSSSIASEGTETSYDGLGRIIQTRENVSPYATTMTDYLSSNKTKVTNPNGFSTTTSYSGYGSPSDGKPTLISSPEGVNTAMSYDIYGNILTVRQYGAGSDFTQRWSYDSRLRLCRHHTRETGSTLFEYDNANRLTAKAEGQDGQIGCASLPSNSKITYSYDVLDRQTFVNYPYGTPDLTYRYDANGNFTQLLNGAGNWYYSYDAHDAIETERLNIDSKNFNLAYSYDVYGGLLSQTYPDGDVVNFAPNPLGQATQAIRNARVPNEALAARTYASNASYYPTGSLDTFTYGNGYVHKTTLNSRKLPSSIRDSKSATALFYEYQYDANANVTRIDNNVYPAYSLDTLQYDGLDRLSSTDGGSGIGDSDITYDVLGNIKTYKSKNRDLVYTYDGRNRLDRVYTPGGATLRDMSYDARGNVTNNSKLSFSYNYANQMTRAKGSSYSYLYDGHNRRVKQTDTKGTTYSIYNQSGTLVYRENNGKGINYIYLGKKLIAKDGVIPTNSPTLNYRPFGESLEQTNDDVGYTGHKFDTDLGLSYMQARYYDPVIGRFYSNDPVGFKGVHSFNRYAYANNNPYKYTDPDGREVKVQWHEVKVGPYNSGKNHSLITITPDNPSHFNNFRRISPIGQLTNSNGQRYGTMGAGPNPAAAVITGSADLKSDFNRSLDAPEHSGGITVTLPKGVSEEQFVDKLIELDSNYQDNADYSFDPDGKSTFNSNSYVSGLLEAAGVDTSKMNVPDAPGFDKPLPKSAFEKQ
jgi:RHS repeat-associated protein